jgi:hypothetical protein
MSMSMTEKCVVRKEQEGVTELKTSAEQRAVKSKEVETTH